MTAKGSVIFAVLKLPVWFALSLFFYLHTTNTTKTMSEEEKEQENQFLERFRSVFSLTPATNRVASSYDDRLDINVFILEFWGLFGRHGLAIGLAMGDGRGIGRLNAEVGYWTTMVLYFRILKKRNKLADETQLAMAEEQLQAAKERLAIKKEEEMNEHGVEELRASFNQVSISDSSPTDRPPVQEHEAEEESEGSQSQAEHEDKTPTEIVEEAQEVHEKETTETNE